MLRSPLMIWWRDPLRPLQRRLGYRFRDRRLLERALTHRSFAYEAGLSENYERLEFLGDAVLGLVVAEALFADHPDLAEGDLSKLKSQAVSSPALSRYAAGIGLGEELRVGVGEERTGGREKPSLLADSMEAVLGAVFLDGGLAAARRVIAPLLERALGDRPEPGHGGAKTRLQEISQARGWELPVYRQVAAEGPDHRKRFTVECLVAGEQVGVGEGGSKKLAEQRAAAAALVALAKLDPLPAGS